MRDEAQDDMDDYDMQTKGSRRKKKQLSKNVTFKEEAKKAKTKSASIVVEKPIQVKDEKLTKK